MNLSSNIIKSPLARSLKFTPIEFEQFLAPHPDDSTPAVVQGTEEAAAKCATVKPECVEDAAANSEIIRKATEAAQSILDKAKADAEQLVQEARAKGYRDGKEEGAKEAMIQATKAAKQEVAAAVSAFKNVADKVDSLRHTLFHDNEKELLGLVLGVTRLVLNQEISTDKRLVLEQIRRAAKIVGEADEVLVKLNPLDQKIAKDHVEELVPEGRSMSFKIVADKSVEVGGCVIECDRGTVDARISTQMKRIESAFDQAMKAENSRSPESESAQKPLQQAQQEAKDA
jgi:flagellar biosynthesis/type III secretory pathway protein FliH